MTIIYNMALNKSKTIINPECLPLEDLKIKTFVNGQSKDVPALDEHWVSHGRVFVQYFPPLLVEPSEPYPMGAKEDWLERMSYFEADMKWLLGLNHHRFWSQIVIGEESLIGVESFLQEATPFYVVKSFPNDEKMIEVYKIAQHLVFLVLIRLTTQQESQTDWIGVKKLAQLWYEKYLITLPIMFDMCLLYGQNNRQELTKIFERIFTIQPKYNEDVKQAIHFVDERLQMVQEKVSRNSSNHSLKLFDHGNNTHSSRFSLLSLTDLLLYVLDTSVNLTSFLAVYQPASVIFHNLNFEARIVSTYENTIMGLCRELDLLTKKEDSIDVYFDLKFKLDLTRLELLKLFRYCSYSSLKTLLDPESNSLSDDEIKSLVDNFISILSEFLSDKVFVQDYDKAYPVDIDLNMLGDICPDLDSVKRDFLIESVLSSYDSPRNIPKANVSLASSSKASSSTPYMGPTHLANGNDLPPKTKVKGIELQSLISAVKDIMPHLGDGFLQKCLEYYDYNSANVINAILESTLPEPLECLDMEMAAVEEDDTQQVNGLLERNNVFDNDEFDIMTQDHINTSRVHRGKWKHGYRNTNDMLNDKSHISQLKESYARLGIVEDEIENIYEDEYDDTYDGIDTTVKEADEPERRPFTTPRVLQSGGRDNSPDSERSDAEEGMTNEPFKFRDEFIENPEVVRARLAERRQQKYHRGGGGGPPRDVTGKPRGHGQESDVTRNRDYKGAHKSTFSNHNRRAGAQRKRNQGMMPS